MFFLEKETFWKWNYQMNEMCTLFGWIKITTFCYMRYWNKNERRRILPKYTDNSTQTRHKISIAINKIRWEVSFANKLHTISDIIRITFSRKDESSSVVCNFREEGNTFSLKSVLLFELKICWTMIQITKFFFYYMNIFTSLNKHSNKINK